jgi:hypothetical protein
MRHTESKNAGGMEPKEVRSGQDVDSDDDNRETLTNGSDRGTKTTMR